LKIERPSVHAKTNTQDAPRTLGEIEKMRQVRDVEGTSKANANMPAAAAFFV